MCFDSAAPPNYVDSCKHPTNSCSTRREPRMASEKQTLLPKSSNTKWYNMRLYMTSFACQTLWVGESGARDLHVVHDVYMYWCTDVSHAHLNVPIHLTVNGICHMKGTLWWFSKIDEATELTDSPDHRLWSTPTEVCRSFLPYLGVISPLSVGTRWVECRRRSDLTLSSSASSLSILEVRLVMVLRERDTWKIKWGGQRKKGGREGGKEK